jgi:RNA polymerase sigma factor (sigma-70 family)
MDSRSAECIDRMERYVNHLHKRGQCRGLSNDEMVAEGLLGLAESNARYSSRSKANRWTFAAPRIRGRIMDAARKEARAWHRQVGDEPITRGPKAGVGSEEIWPENRPSVDHFNSPVNAPLERRTIESRLNAREMSRILGQCLLELPPRRRRMVVECGLKGRPAREVGRELGLTRGRSARFLKRGLEEVKRNLEMAGYSLADFV